MNQSLLQAFEISSFRGTVVFLETTPKINQPEHFEEPLEMVASFLHMQATCETVNFVQTGHLEFSFLLSFLVSFCCKSVLGQKWNCEENLKCTKLYSIKLELLDSMKS